MKGLRLLLYMFLLMLGLYLSGTTVMAETKSVEIEAVVDRHDPAYDRCNNGSEDNAIWSGRRVVDPPRPELDAKLVMMSERGAIEASMEERVVLSDNREEIVKVPLFHEKEIVNKTRPISRAKILIN